MLNLKKPAVTQTHLLSCTPERTQPASPGNTTANVEDLQITVDDATLIRPGANVISEKKRKDDAGPTHEEHCSTAVAASFQPAHRRPASLEAVATTTYALRVQVSRLLRVVENLLPLVQSPVKLSWMLSVAQASNTPCT